MGDKYGELIGKFGFEMQANQEMGANQYEHFANINSINCTL